MAEKIRFFPMDVIYKIIDDKPVIHLFGKTEDNKQICVLYDKFEPYLYVMPKPGTDIADELRNLKIRRDEVEYSVTKVEAVKKIYLGKDVDALKVYTKFPSEISVIREELENNPNIESINESDILFVRRFLIDNNVTPLTLHEVEGDFVSKKLKVPASEKLELLKRINPD